MTSGGKRQALRAADLLSIDVGAELRSIGEAQLLGPWQAPAELVRYLIARGATQVEVALGRRSVLVDAPGATCSDAELEALTSTLSRAAPAQDRHRALLDLERAGALALIWAARLDGAGLLIERCGENGQVTTLRCHPGRRPARSMQRGGSRPLGVSVRVEGSRVDRGRAAAWLGRACRFSPLPIRINGRAAPVGFVGGLYRLRLRRPLNGWLAITREGELPRLWLLQHGLLATRAVVPGYPPFEAAVELSEIAPPGASAAALRELVTPCLAEIIDQAVQMCIRLVPRLDRMDQQARLRLISFLLDAAQLGLRQREILDLEIVPMLQPTGELTRVSLIRLAGTVGASPGADLAALDPGDGVGEQVTLSAPAAVLGPAQRQSIHELLGIRTRLVHPAAEHKGLHRLLGRGLGLARDLLDRLRVMLAPRPVQTDRLSTGEARLVAGIETSSVVAGGRGRPRIGIFQGDRRVYRLARRRMVLLGRSHAMLGYSQELMDRDPAWLYLIARAALGDTASPRQELRSQWHRAVIAEAERLSAPAEQVSR